MSIVREGDTVVKVDLDDISLDTPGIFDEENFSYTGDLHKEMLYNMTLASTGYSGKYALRRLRPYQLDFAWAMIDSVVNKYSDELIGFFARQSGKTEANASAFYLLSLLPSFWDDKRARPLKMAVYGPKTEQAEIMYERLIEKFEGGFARDFLDVTHIATKKKITLSNGSVIKCKTASRKASVEGDTWDLVLAEEAQDIDDIRLIKSMFPMTAARAGTRAMTGTATPERLGYFYQATRRQESEARNLKKKRRTFFKVLWTDGAKYSPDYKKIVMEDMRKFGVGSEYFRTQYLLEWVTFTKNFVVEEDLTAIRATVDYIEKYRQKVIDEQLPIYVGIDTAKANDSTVVTIMATNGAILDWLELRGEHYNDQVPMIDAFICQYNVMLVVIDAYGNGTAVGDYLAIKYDVEAFPFDAGRKSRGYILLMGDIKDRQEVAYGEFEQVERYTFEQQLLNLQKRFTGKLMHVSHPKKGPAEMKKDDYPDSFMLANWGRKRDFMYEDGDSTSDDGIDVEVKEEEDNDREISFPRIPRPDRSFAPRNRYTQSNALRR